MIRQLVVSSIKRTFPSAKVHRIRLALGRANDRLWAVLRPGSFDSRLAEAQVHYAVRSPMRGEGVKVDDDRVNESFRRAATGDRAEYLYRVQGGCLVEPRFGFAILPPAGIAWQSVTQTDYVAFPEHCTDFGCVPSPLDYLARSGISVRHEPKVALLRTLHENNYWHFLHDCLGKVSFYADHGIDENIPVVAGSHLYDSRFFQEALGRGFLAGRTILRQDSLYIRSDEVVFGSPFPHERARFEAALDLLKVPAPNPKVGRRVYLTRSRARGRFIANDPEICKLCAEFGFEAVDTDWLSLAEQMELFGSIRYLIGVHGAGLTNMIFRRDAPLSLLELFDPGHIGPHYAWLAQDFGHPYDALVGDRASEGGVRIDPGSLRSKITRLLDT